jgi:SnoaL-like domain
VVTAPSWHPVFVLERVDPAKAEDWASPAAQFAARPVSTWSKATDPFEGGIQMHVDQDSPAVAVAHAHTEAWSNHDWDKARASLAPDVHVTVTTTQPTMAATDLTGVDAYMQGLIDFAQAVVPGSARVIASLGDKRNALLMLTVEADFGRGPVTLPAARLYLLDEDDRIKAEQVVFYAALD